MKVKLNRSAIIWMFLAFLLYFPPLIFGKTALIDGKRFWWLWEDAMISMRYAKNLAEGHGLVWNRGQYVAGYTNLAWVLYLSLIHLLPLPLSKISLVVHLTNLFLLVVSIPILHNLVEKLNGGTFATHVTLGLYLVSSVTMTWSASGSEMLLVTVLVVFLLGRLLEAKRTFRDRVLDYTLMGIVSWVRADALVLTVLLVGFDFYTGEKKGPSIFCLGITVLLATGPFLFRFFYYGNWVPNTAQLKLYDLDQRLWRGILYSSKFVKDHLVFFLLSLLGILRQNQKFKTLFLFILAVVGYVTWVGGDFFEDYRFYLPLVPLLLALGVVELEKRFGSSLGRVVVVCLGLVLMPTIFQGTVRKLIEPDEASIDRIKMAMFLANNTPSDSSVAHFAAGNIFYFSNRRGVDFLGKMDPVVATTPAVAEMGAGHNKWDFDHSLNQLKPDYVVTFLPNEGLRRYWKKYRYQNKFFVLPRYYRQLYFHPSFQKHCLPNVIPTDTRRDLVHCKWSEPSP